MKSDDFYIYKKFKLFELKSLRKKKAINFDESFYRMLNYKIENRTVGEILKNDWTYGNCYYYAFLLALALPDCKLVYDGKLHKLDLDIRNSYFVEFGHAWVEKGDFVFDTTLKQVVKKDYYYKYFNAEIKDSCRSYLLKDDTLLEIGLKSVRFRSELVAQLFKINEFKYAEPLKVQTISSEFENVNVKEEISKFTKCKNTEMVL